MISRILEKINDLISIEDKRFINVAISFGVNKKDDKGYIEKCFNELNSVRLPIEKEKQLNLPKGITLRKTYDYNVLKSVCKMNKEFKLIKSKEGTGFQKKNNQWFATKSTKDIVAVSFQPTSKYSPKELIIDLPFLIWYSDTEIKNRNLEKLYFVYVHKPKKEIIVLEKTDFLEIEYPLKERLKLYKKNQLIDEYAFTFKFKGLTEAASFESNNVKREFKDIIKNFLQKS